MSTFTFTHRETVWRSGGRWHQSNDAAPVVLAAEWLAGVDPTPAGDQTQGHGGRLVLRKGYRLQVSPAIATELRAAGYGASIRTIEDPEPVVEREHNVPPVWTTAGQADAIAALEARISALEGVHHPRPALRSVEAR